MAQDCIEWKKDQDVEIYDLSQKKWIIGKIHDILEEDDSDDDQKIYCIDYEVYSREIHQKDVNSLMRIPKTGGHSVDNDVKKTFLNISDQIAPKFAIPEQIQILSDKLPRSVMQRMIYLQRTHISFASVSGITLISVALNPL